jgi:hypothetical protein
VWSICAGKEKIYVHGIDDAGGLQPKGTDWLINRSIIEIRSRIDAAIYRLNKRCSRELSETWIHGSSSELHTTQIHEADLKQAVVTEPSPIIKT